MSKATHPCDACGGSGIGAGLRCPCHGVASTCCPVCLGEGRFSDRMPIADAVADAETLEDAVGVSPVPMTEGEWVLYREEHADVEQ